MALPPVTKDSAACVLPHGNPFSEIQEIFAYAIGIGSLGFQNRTSVPEIGKLAFRIGIRKTGSIPLTRNLESNTWNPESTA